MDAAAYRKARQVILTDRYFGLDYAPISRVEMVEEEASLDERRGRPERPGFTSERSRVAEVSEPRRTTEDVARSEVSADERWAALETLAAELTRFVEESWTRDGWNRMVFGEGRPDAEIMFIGEGPGADEDRQGRPFVGRAGQLLDKQIAAMGLAREDVYIANIAKTRPPGNRVPTPQEAERWMPWLDRQIEIITPRVIVTLGATSAKYLLGNPRLSITRERGQWKLYRGIHLMPTFHPAYLLRQYTKENRARVWEDLKMVLQQVGLKAPK